ncbi:hypothetical protein FY528_18715 [Hymenobacter lutimineralis]|uniref:Uncharacterized protein n=1 Tax=Hymenobacter lutimineralis TaxID=2606448 RepID=A0A5D6UUE7_9BACT|nr:hypothetical protein [Hymenobacter lutimineralis]TYZ06272.1 hypothetical protein FY528_18715 [Hymenobacter lutimineralis]
MEKSFSLPGLGVLLLAETMVSRLSELALHSALAVQLRYPDGRAEAATATVEEVSREASTTTESSTTRALLLTHAEAAPVPAGTEVWWAGEEAAW